MSEDQEGLPLEEQDQAAVKQIVPPRRAPSSPPPIDSGDEGGDTWLTSYADLMTLIACFFIMLVAFANYDPQIFNAKTKPLAKYFGGDQQKIDELAEELRNSLQNNEVMKEITLIKQIDDGLAMQFISSTLFNPGEAALRDDVVDTLDIMIDLIKEKNPGFRIIVEGHTDSTPFKPNGKFISNWDLSAARAARVIERFESQGFNKDQMVAVGYGDTRPIAPNKDAKGKPLFANQQTNRRVVIKVLLPPKDKLNVSPEQKALFAPALK